MATLALDIGPRVAGPRVVVGPFGMTGQSIISFSVIGIAFHRGTVFYGQASIT